MASMEKSEILVVLQSRESELAERVAELDDLKQELVQVRDAIKALGGPVANNHVNGYSPSWVWSDKIKFIIKQKGEVTNYEIAEFVAKKESKVLTEILPVVSSMTSKMLKAGDIEGRKTDDGKNIYTPSRA